MHPVYAAWLFKLLHRWLSGFSSPSWRQDNLVTKLRWRYLTSVPSSTSFLASPFVLIASCATTAMNSSKINFPTMALLKSWRRRWNRSLFATWNSLTTNIQITKGYTKNLNARNLTSKNLLTVRQQRSNLMKNYHNTLSSDTILLRTYRSVCKRIFKKHIRNKRKTS